MLKNIVASRTGRTLLLTFALVIPFGGCGDPLSVETPRRMIMVNIDSVLLSEPFFNKSTDTLFALVDGRPVAFSSELLRPVFYNRYIGDDEGWYISVQGAKYGVKGEEYASLSLRLDGIKDTGTFSMNDKYSLPKRVDTSVPSKYAGKYERRGTNTQTYSTTSSQPNGEIRVVGMDTVRGIIVGTFTFVGNDGQGDRVHVESGMFRLRLNVQ